MSVTKLNSLAPFKYNFALSGSSTFDWIATNIPSGTLAASASIAETEA